jgi:hypothetical protein
MKKILCLALAIAISGCTTVSYNGADTVTRGIDYPKVGTEMTAYVGDHMVEKGLIAEQSVLVIANTIDGSTYDIPAGTYLQIGADKIQNFYSTVTIGGNYSVKPALLADPAKAISVKKGLGQDVCVITLYGVSSCFKGQYARKRQLAESAKSFQQTLIYSGRVGDKINIGYREFSKDIARPAFNNDVEYDLSTSKVIGYKGALIEVIKADNSSITYKLIRNFP